MSPLESAIAVLQAEVDSFGQGTKNQPDVNTPDWFVLRAKAAGLSLLKRMQVLSLSDPKLADRFYRMSAVDFKQTTAEEVVAAQQIAEADRAASIEPAEVVSP